MINYEEERKRAAAHRTYTTPAVLTLVLYFIFWLPGLIANIVYFLQARGDQAITGRQPDGYGCLLALLIVFGVLPVLAVCLLFAGFLSI